MDTYANKLFSLVVDPVVKILFVLAVFYFVFGVVKYIVQSNDTESRIEGGKHILYSTIGLFVMASAWGIIALLKSILPH